MKVNRRALGKNSLAWLAEGPGAHGDEPLSPEEVKRSLEGGFRFVPESEGQLGLRPPQLGALHAILASESVKEEGPITVVLPTGTGKTETMLAGFANRPDFTVVVVPSDNLRTQISNKFVSLGILPATGSLPEGFRTPAVAVLKSRLQTAEEADVIINQANVVVATAAALSGSAEPALRRLADTAGHLFIDEAHHVAARTWRTIAETFDKVPIVQFTATPFREDGQFMGGRLAYRYPLRLAQESGYFSDIRYQAVSTLDEPDRTLAEAAVAQLREDISNGLNHLLMARTMSIRRAEEILELYADIAPDLKPVRIDSKMALTRQREALAKLGSESRVVVCVDMLGEGFDLPNLKVAAIHDPHKSLAVTLQFVGRFARGVDDPTIGDASVFVPRQADVMDERLRRLYSEDADWNALLRDLTTAEVDQELERSEFEEGFARLPKEVSMRSLEPKMSTVVYRAQGMGWSPSGISDVFPEESLLTKTVGINEQEHVLWFITEERTPVKWGEVAALDEVTHHLYVVHADLQAGLLYINSSNNDLIHEALAKAIGGVDVEIIRGDVVYRVLSQIQRRIPTNVGLLDAMSRTRRFTMHVGADVLEGFGPDATQKSKTNIFAHGFAGEAHVSYGASRKGRIWSHKVAYTLHDWVKWAEHVGALITDENITLESVMSGFIIPREATARPDLVPLGIEWPYDIVATISERRMITYNGGEVPLIDTELIVTKFDNQGPIEFELQSADWALAYKMEFGNEGPFITAIAGDASITSGNQSQPLATFMTRNGMTVYFEQEALLSPDGYILQPDRERPRFDPANLEVIDWDGIDLHKESEGPDRAEDSIQYRVRSAITEEDDWDIIINDDGPGEVGDLVFFKRHERRLAITLVHCKYSSGDAPGARIGDLYEVCGQAAKSHKAKSEVYLILRKLIRREKKRRADGREGLIHGTEDELVNLARICRQLDIDCTVIVAQPGLSQAGMSHAQAELLACTQLYLSQTYGAAFRVICSG